MSVRISVMGCCLVDYLYSPVDFTGDAFLSYASRVPGDGGLEPGKLVFVEDLEAFSGTGEDKFLADLSGCGDPVTVNVGGPAIVAAINAAQILGDDGKVSFFGVYGDDHVGDTLRKLLAGFPVDLDRFSRIKGSSPCTFVLSDPGYNDGFGERTFINRIGTSWSIKPQDIPDDFFASDILFFGATAVLPHIHQALDILLKMGRDAGAINIVSTVFDFINEKKDPASRWPLGSGDRSYTLTDLLVTDREEALRLSGRSSLTPAGEFFIEKGLKAFVITQGAEDVYLYSSGARFRQTRPRYLPVSERVKREIREGKAACGDTTGCGDNFAGGVLASVAMQLGDDGTGKPDLTEACAWGTASGGFACFSMGGAFPESEPGEKRKLLEDYFGNYLAQIGTVRGKQEKIG